MRSKVVRVLVLALALGGVGIALGQERPPVTNVLPTPQKRKPAPEKSKLETMLAEALKNNPDIRVAAAKLAEADAELNRARLQVTQKVIHLYLALQVQEVEVKRWTSECERITKNVALGGEGSTVLEESRRQLKLAKAKLAELESQLPALLGNMSRTAGVEIPRPPTRMAFSNDEKLLFLEFDTDMDVRVVPHRGGGPMAERIRKALQTPVKVDYKDMTFGAILNDLSKKVEGLTFRNLFERGGGLSEGKMSLHFEEALPLSTILQALADETGCLFFVRDYGIVATQPNRVPPGAMKVEEFLREKPADPTQPENRDEQSPNAHMMWNPPDNIEGTIEKIESGGLMELTFNNVDGLLSGHTLYLYRPAEGKTPAKYLGTIRMINVLRKKGPNGQGSLAQPIGRFTETPKVGDKATGRKPSK
jgi:hypothetical protein